MKSAPSKTTTVNEPNKYALPYVKDAMAAAQAAFQAQPTSYSGPVAALPQQGQYDAYNSMLGQLQPIAQAGQQQVQAGANWAQQLASGQKDVAKLENYNYAGLDRALEANARPIMEKYTQQLIPQFKSDTLAQGAGGNSRALELMPSIFNQQMSRELSDSFARMSLEDISSIRENQPKTDMMNLQLAQALPQLAQGGLIAPAMQQQILQSLQGLDQQSIDAALQKIGLNQELAFGPVERYGNIISGFGGGSSTTSTTAGKNPLQGALGGAMGGAGIASALAMSNPATAGVMGVMALLGGLFG